MPSAKSKSPVRRSTRPTNRPPTKETGATVKKSRPSGKKSSRRPTTRSDALSVGAGERSRKPIPDDDLESEDTAESTGDSSSDEESGEDAREDSTGDGVLATTSGGEDVVGVGVVDESISENRGDRKYPDPTLPLPRGAISFVVSWDLSQIHLPPALTITPLRTRCPLGVRDDVHPPQHFSIQIPAIAEFIRRFDPSLVTYDKEEEEIAQRFREDNWRSSPWGRWILGAGSTPEEIRRSFYHLRISLDAFRFQFVLYRPIHPATLPSDPLDSLYIPNKHPKPDKLEAEAKKKWREEMRVWVEVVEASRVKVTERWEEAVDVWHAYHKERSALIDRTLRSLFQLGLFCRLVYLREISLPSSTGPLRAPPSMFVQVPPRASSSKQGGSSAVDPAPPLIGDSPLADTGDVDQLSDSGGSAKRKGKKRKKRKRSRSPWASEKAKGKVKVVEIEEEGEPGDPSTYNALAWHVAHDPFSKGDPTNVRGGPLYNRGWNSSQGSSAALARGLEPWQVLTKVLPEFDWEETDRQLQLLNATYTNFICDWFVEHMLSIAGVNINERMLARCFFRRQMPGYESLGSPVFAPAVPSSAPSTSLASSFVPLGQSTVPSSGAGDALSAKSRRANAIVERATSAVGQMWGEFMRSVLDIGDSVGESLRGTASSPSKEMEEGEDDTELEDDGTAPSSPFRPREDTSFPMDVSPLAGGRGGGSACSNAGSSRIASIILPEVGDGNAQMPLAPPLRFGRPAGLEPPSSPPRRLLLVPGPTSPRFSSIPPVATLNTSSDRPSSIAPSPRTMPRPSSIAASTSPRPVLDSPPRVPSPGGSLSLPPPPPPRPSPPKMPELPASGPSFRAPTLTGGDGLAGGSPSSPPLPRSELSPDFVRAMSMPCVSRGRSRGVSELASPSSLPHSIKQEERENFLKAHGTTVDLTEEDVEMEAP
ncbi:hypothetical protein FB451DRAFT_1198167 [Mycena latifolia]|nr:hypothetical protein FB451DRAFT_1198167 [Mycena latifolia]